MPMYTDAERAKAIELVALHKGDTKTVAELTGIGEATLKRWMAHPEKRPIADLLEDALEQIMDNMPSTWRGNDWAVAVGILADKIILLRGGATSRSETITKTVADLPEDERADVIAEAERILAELRG